MKNSNQVGTYMSDYPWVTTKATPIVEARAFMKKCGVRHFPVVEAGRLVGIISDRDLRQATLLADAINLCVADIMKTNPYCVESRVPLADVAREMAARKYGCAVIVDDRGSVKGIFTTTDGMNLLSQLLSSQSAPTTQPHVRDEATTSPLLCVV